jgi:arylsulfatase A-like enzyme
MKDKVSGIIILLTFCSLYQCNTEVSAGGEMPNIILCMADDQGWGDMGYYGHPVIKTPAFDAMAAEALRFDRFYAAAPVCSPTRGSVMTGRHPNRFACFTWGRTLRPQEITLAEVLKEAGYVTGHFGKWHLGSVRQDSPVNPGASGFDEWFSAPNFFDTDPILSDKGVAVRTEGESSMVVVEAALDFIRRHEGGKRPYFAVVWFGSPHGPHLSAGEYLALYDDQPEKLVHFYGEITGMDHAFGRLRDSVMKLNSYKNTILWYCSDNGGLRGIGSTGGRGHKGQVYEGGLRVPALIEWPSVITEPGVTRAPASTSDIFPTILDITGMVAEIDLPLDGISLLPLFKGEMEKRSRSIGFWSYPAAGIRTPSAEWMSELLDAQQKGDMVGDSSRLRLDDIRISALYPLDTLPGHAAWLEWPWKLHRILEDPENVHWELFDLEQDSMETTNIIGHYPEVARSMKASLEQWQQSVVRSMNGEDYQ